VTISDHGGTQLSDEADLSYEWWLFQTRAAATGNAIVVADRCGCATLMIPSIFHFEFYFVSM